MAHSRIHWTLVTVGLFTIAAVLAPGARSVAFAASASTVEMSAQVKKDEDDKNKKKTGPVQNQNKPANVQKNLTVQPKPQFQQKQNVEKKLNVPDNKKVHVEQDKKITIQKKTLEFKKQDKITVDKKLVVTPKNGVQKKLVGPPKQFKPKHQNVVYQFKLKNSKQAFVKGKNYSVYYNNYRVRHRGRWATFIALGLLTPLAIGAATYYPYAYLNVPEPYCEGLTEDGCELVYNEVETVEGFIVPQCVAYCPWQP